MLRWKLSEQNFENFAAMVSKKGKNFSKKFWRLATLGRHNYEMITACSVGENRSGKRADFSPELHHSSSFRVCRVHSHPACLGLTRHLVSGIRQLLGGLWHLVSKIRQFNDMFRVIVCRQKRLLLSVGVRSIVTSGANLAGMLVETGWIQKA